MESVYGSFRIIILCSLSVTSLSKPCDEEKAVDKSNYMDDKLDYGRNNLNSFSGYYKPRPFLENSEKFPSNKYFQDDKRSVLNDDIDSTSLDKREVGVVYKNTLPIGILQPYQRTYRFIPVKEQESVKAEDLSYDLPASSSIDKREAEMDAARMDASYPLILTNFKIDNKLDKKRNYDAFDDENVEELKTTIRRLRSNSNNEQIEEKLKNILDDMGLIDDEESHGEKREATDKQFNEQIEKERNKRDENCIRNENNNKPASEQNLLNNGEVKNDAKSEDFSNGAVNNRQKRQKDSGLNKENSEIFQNLRDSGDLMVSGNKSPLASSFEVARDTQHVNDDDYESRVERQIQSKINSLKEEVKREIEELKNKQYDDYEDDTQRKKRQAPYNLIHEENDAVNPVNNPENELKPLVRKRRGLTTEEDKNLTDQQLTRKKRETYKRKEKRSSNKAAQSNEKKYKAYHEDSNEGGELLGDDVEEGTIAKRQINDPAEDTNEYFYRRGKRSNLQHPYQRLKRQNFRRFVPSRFSPYLPNKWQSRFRRRINQDELMMNRPQQLSDMSDVDLFGALPQSYDGELSRYKRVKRNKI